MRDTAINHAISVINGKLKYYEKGVFVQKWKEGNINSLKEVLEFLEQLKDKEKDIITEAYSQGRIDEETRFPYAEDGEEYYRLEFTQTT